MQQILYIVFICYSQCFPITVPSFKLSRYDMKFVENIKYHI